MICLRCGYCCHNYLVTIIDDPEKDLSEDNVTFHEGNGPCKHLEGNSPGGYSCKVHSKPWYNETPCFSHCQIEESPNDECRIGKRILTDKSSAIYKSLERNEA